MHHFCLLLIISDPGQCADLGDGYSTGMIGAPKVGPAVKNKTWRTKSQFMLGKNPAARFL